MKRVLADIQDGTFAKNFVAECDAGKPEMKRSGIAIPSTRSRRSARACVRCSAG